MTWNPRDLSIHQKAPGTPEDGFRLPPPPPRDADPATFPFVPRSTPVVAEALEWDLESDEHLAFPQDLQRTLEYEGIVAQRCWDQWSRVVMRGHYT